jgi:hypothetical protein
MRCSNARPAKPRHLDHPIAVSLENLVPRDHVYRHLEAALDVRFVRDSTPELDAYYLEKVRGYHAIEPYKEAICERQVWVEPHGVLPDDDPLRRREPHRIARLDAKGGKERVGVA